jgi:alpha-L-rhamnosidase
MGWTGDIQVFAPTASFLYDCHAFLASWLVDLALEQSAGGGVPVIVPNVLSWATRAAAGWGDAATVVPSVLYERFGDVSVLETQYDSMRAWADQTLALAGPRRLWENQFQFGDWLDPDAPADQPGKAKVHHDVVATAYLYWSTALVARAAVVLGRSDDAQRYGRVAEEIRDAWLAAYATPDGRVVSDAPTGYALAIMFEIPRDEALRQRMGNRLAWLVRRAGYRIGTGFLGTPIVLDALAKTGHVESAARLLLQTENPSWLYPVTMGATTIWERWDSILEDGSINPGEMTSFNHYAFGAVADWLHRAVAGLAPIEPGYQTLAIAPYPLVGLDWAEASHETPYGRAAVRWETTGRTITVSAVVPPNTRARVRLPGRTDAFEVGSGEFGWQVDDPRPAPTPRLVSGESSLADVIDDPEAYREILTVLSSADPDRARTFRKHTEWVSEQTLTESLLFTPSSVLARIAHALAELNVRRGIESNSDAGSSGAEDDLPQVIQQGRHVAAGIEEPLKL